MWKESFQEWEEDQSTLCKIMKMETEEDSVFELACEYGAVQVLKLLKEPCLVSLFKKNLEAFKHALENQSKIAGLITQEHWDEIMEKIKENNHLTIVEQRYRGEKR